MDGGWTRYLVIMVASALVMLALASWDRNRPPDRRGWRSLKPGATYMFAIGVGTLLTLAMSYIWLFVGSTRPDGERQMEILFWLILTFGTATLITLFQYRVSMRSAMHWRGDLLHWQAKGTEHRRKLTEAVRLRRTFMGPYYVVFNDGQEARVDPYTNNAMALVEMIADRLNPDDAGSAEA